MGVQITTEIIKEEVDIVIKEGSWEKIGKMCEERWTSDAFVVTKQSRGNSAFIAGDADAVVLFDPEKSPSNIKITEQRQIKVVIELNKIKRGTVATLQNTRRW